MTAKQTRSFRTSLNRALHVDEEEGLVSIGPEAERSLGWRHFVELTGIVSSDPEIVVRFGQAEVGRVHPLSFRRTDAEYVPILLGGRSWRITSIDWRRGIAYAVPDPRPGKSRWRGDARARSTQPSAAQCARWRQAPMCQPD